MNLFLEMFVDLALIGHVEGFQYVTTVYSEWLPDLKVPRYHEIILYETICLRLPVKMREDTCTDSVLDKHLHCLN